MNIDIVKNKIASNLNKKVVVTVYGLRNKITRYEGILYKTYPNIFTILYEGNEKSFTYTIKCKKLKFVLQLNCEYFKIRSVFYGNHKSTCSQGW